MPKDNQIDPRTNFVPRFLPLLLGAVMLLVYWFTMNHWLTLANVGPVAQVAGWEWQPSLLFPLTFLFTLPFRWVPAAQAPLMLNFFSVLCAAATLAVLARSVAILPHDRTEMERTRERSDYAFLTGWVAWVPPVAAVLFAGLHFSFWQHATSWTGESFQLLWFAVIVWQLLEYRLDEREGRLFLAAFFYGAGLADNWALVPFFPLFLVMIIWLRKLEFFDLTFLGRMVLCGLAGLALYFLMPILAHHSGAFPQSFWQMVKLHLRSDWQVVRLVSFSEVRHDIALMSLTSLLPVFLMSLRWSSSFGDSSRLGTMLVNYLFHGVAAFLFGALVWVTFDPPFSPHKLIGGMGVAAPAMTIYYLVALCIGYYGGYLLLVFGKKPVPGRRGGTPPAPALPAPLLWLCPVIVAVTLAAMALAAGLLIYKNAPSIRAANDDTLLNYARLTTQNLPREGAILLTDDDTQILGWVVEAALARDGRARSYPVINARSLMSPPYHQYLHERFPKIWPQTVTTNEAAAWGVSPLHLIYFLDQLSKTNQLFYLNPSFGYYFEKFYQEPHGLIYALKPLPSDTLLPPILNKNLVAENVAFWKQVLDSSQPAINLALHPVDYQKLPGAIGRAMKHLHPASEVNPSAIYLANFYSRSLNFLGVQCQRAGELQTAATLFRQSEELNQDNIVAGINLAFNRNLQAGVKTAVEPSRTTTDQFGKYHDWNEVMAANGPFDDINFISAYACSLNPIYTCQILAQFARVHELAPENLVVRRLLAQIYLANHLPDRALAALSDPLAHPELYGLNKTNSSGIKMLAASIYVQKNELARGVEIIEQEVAMHPSDNVLLTSAARAFLTRGLFTNAVHIINLRLAQSPDDPQWLFGLGFAQLQMTNYNGAITTFTHVLQVSTNYDDARLDRKSVV